MILESGYDIILVCINIFMVPSFLALAAATGVISAAMLVHGWLVKKRIVRQRQAAVEELGK